MTNENQASWATLTLKADSAKESVVKHTLSTTQNTVIGRSPDCEISLNPHEFITVSRRHAQIKLVNGDWQIRDLGTTNGTLVNNCPLDNSQQLASGDLITLGVNGPEFTFECQTFNSTVMMNSTEIKADILEPAKSEAITAKSNNNPVAIPKAVAEAGIVFFASQEQEVKANPEPPQSSVAEPQPELEAQKEIATPAQPSPSSIVEPQSSPDSIIEPQPELKAEKTTAKTFSNATNTEAIGNSSVAVSQKKPVAPTARVTDSSRTLWNLVSTLELCQISGHSESVLGLAFSPEGKTLASVAKDKTIKLWNIASQSENATLTGHKLAPNTVVFSPNGKILASGGADKIIKLWQLDSQQEIASLAGHKLAIGALAFSPNGKILASGGADKIIKLWQLDSQQEITTLAGHKLAIGALAFSLDGRILASGSKDRTIKLWQLDSQQEIATLAGHKQGILAISFSPDSKKIASAGADQTIKLWNVETQTEIATIATPDWQTGAIAIAADGRTFAGSNQQGAIKLWQI